MKIWFLLLLLLVGFVASSSTSESDEMVEDSDSQQDLEEDEDSMTNEEEDASDSEQDIFEEDPSEEDSSEEDFDSDSEADALTTSGGFKIVSVIIKCTEKGWYTKATKDYVDGRIIKVNKKLKKMSYDKSYISSGWRSNIIEHEMSCGSPGDYCTKSVGGNPCMRTEFINAGKAAASGKSYKLITVWPPTPTKKELKKCADRPVCFSSSMIGGSDLLIAPVDVNWKQYHHSSQTLLHEIGHSFGFLHGWYLQAYKGEYGDPTDVMGNEYGPFIREFGAVRRVQAGWIANKYVKKITSSTDISSEPITVKLREINNKPRGSDVYWLLRIKSTDNFYYNLEYRGWESTIPSKYRNKISIRLKKVSGETMTKDAGNCGADTSYSGMIAEGKTHDMLYEGDKVVKVKFAARPGNGQTVHVKIWRE